MLVSDTLWADQKILPEGSHRDPDKVCLQRQRVLNKLSTRPSMNWPEYGALIFHLDCYLQNISKKHQSRFNYLSSKLVLVVGEKRNYKKGPSVIGSPYDRTHGDLQRTIDPLTA